MIMIPKQRFAGHMRTIQFRFQQRSVSTSLIQRLGKELPVGDYMEYGTMALGRECWVPCMAHLRLVFLCFNGRPLWVHLYLYDLLCSAEYDESKKKWQGEQGNTLSVVVCCRAWCCVHVCVGSTNFPDQIPLQFWPTINRRSEFFFCCVNLYIRVFLLVL